MADAPAAFDMIKPRAKRARLGRPPAAASPGMRARLLESATALFAERGIASTTMTQIAVRSGVTAAMVHYYFKSREQLVECVVDERIQPIIDVMWAPIDPGVGEPRAFVAAILRRVIDTVAANPWLPAVWVREILSESGRLRAPIASRLPARNVRRFAQEMAAAQARGLINSEIEPKLLFVSIFGLTMLMLATTKLRQRILQTGTHDDRALVRHLTALLVDGIAGNSRGTG